jgi:hypothetical protein
MGKLFNPTGGSFLSFARNLWVGMPLVEAESLVPIEAYMAVGESLVNDPG